MAIYTVHEPPLRKETEAGHGEGFRFVRDGVYVWAFIAPPLWMMWRGLWLVFVLFVAGLATLDIGLAALGVSATTILVIDLLIAFLIGLEASSLRRWTLARRGWRYAGLVSAADEQEAERRFFEKWAEPAQGPSPQGSRAPSPPPRPLRAAAEPGVVGLFPEPRSR